MLAKNCRFFTVCKEVPVEMKPKPFRFFQISGFYPPAFVNIQKSRSCLFDWKVKDFNESEVWRNPCFGNPLNQYRPAVLIQASLKKKRLLSMCFKRSKRNWSTQRKAMYSRHKENIQSPRRKARAGLNLEHYFLDVIALMSLSAPLCHP